MNKFKIFSYIYFFYVTICVTTDEDEINKENETTTSEIESILELKKKFNNPTEIINKFNYLLGTINEYYTKISESCDQKLEIIDEFIYETQNNKDSSNAEEFLSFLKVFKEYYESYKEMNKKYMNLSDQVKQKFSKMIPKHVFDEPFKLSKMQAFTLHNFTSELYDIKTIIEEIHNYFFKYEINKFEEMLDEKQNLMLKTNMLFEAINKHLSLNEDKVLIPINTNYQVNLEKNEIPKIEDYTLKSKFIESLKRVKMTIKILDYNCEILEKLQNDNNSELKIVYETFEYIKNVLSLMIKDVVATIHENNTLAAITKIINSEKDISQFTKQAKSNELLSETLKSRIDEDLTITYIVLYDIMSLIMLNDNKKEIFDKIFKKDGKSLLIFEDKQENNIEEFNKLFEKFINRELELNIETLNTLRIYDVFYYIYDIE